MALPGPGFTVADVADVVGREVRIEVMDVSTQGEVPGGLSLGQWADYFHHPHKRKARHPRDWGGGEMWFALGQQG
jgi:hypothetical protein